MSMHMEGPALTTTRTKKYKLNLTKAKRYELETDMFHYNKKLKRKGETKLTWDEYLDFRCGRVTKRKLHPSEQGTLRADYLALPPHRQNDVKHPSKPMGDGVATKKESIKYTGTLIKGIATMHKSNAIPILDEKQAREVSSMRRG
jgi:hypothetical protein